MGPKRKRFKRNRRGQFLASNLCQPESEDVIIVQSHVGTAEESVAGEHDVVVRAFGLYWGGIRFESLSTHHTIVGP